MPMIVDCLDVSTAIVVGRQGAETQTSKFELFARRLHPLIGMGLEGLSQAPAENGTSHK